MLYCCILGNASSFTLSVDDFPPGDYNFTIDATDVFGQTATAVVELFLSGKNNSNVAEINIAIHVWMRVPYLISFDCRGLSWHPCPQEGANA